MFVAQTDMDAAYANAAFIPDGDSYPARWTEKSEGFRATARANLGVPYGDSPRQAFDLFHPEGAARGVVVFVHGGYWRAFDRGMWSHLAAGPLAAGWAVALPGYDLCPDVRISDITQQIAAAVDEIAQCAPGPMVLSGHSAGGHLAARMGCADIRLECRDRIKRIVPISPLADLAPLMETSMNADLRLDAEEARAESPLHHPAPQCEVTIWVGAAERPALVDQAHRLGVAWGAPVVEDAGRHHFDVIEGLEDEGAMLTMAIVGGL